MERDADLRHEGDEGTSALPRAPESAPDAEAEANWRPLFATVAGIFLTLAVLVVGLAPAWAVILAVGVVGIVLAAIVAMAWGITHVRRPTH
jgi:adenine/guanine phosphoribosyltransferase-like PRPP-binding protein